MRFSQHFLKRIPFPLAMRGAQVLLASQGFGSGGTVASSGEIGVFKLLRRNDPILFDVGGHVGHYSKAFLTQLPLGRVFLFEPSAIHMAKAKTLLSRYDAVTYVEVALSHKQGPATLYKNAEVSGLASLTKRRLDHYKISMDKTESVSCRTLDSVVGELGVDHIDLLKIDVEGHELSALRGAGHTLRVGLVDLIQFEFGGCNLDTRTTLQDFFYFFDEFGYRIHIVHPSGRLVRLSSYSELYEQYRPTNYVAMRDQ